VVANIWAIYGLNGMRRFLTMKLTILYLYMTPLFFVYSWAGNLAAPFHQKLNLALLACSPKRLKTAVVSPSGASVDPDNSIMIVAMFFWLGCYLYDLLADSWF